MEVEIAASYEKNETLLFFPTAGQHPASLKYYMPKKWLGWA